MRGCDAAAAHRSRSEVGEGGECKRGLFDESMDFLVGKVSINLTFDLWKV